MSTVVTKSLIPLPPKAVTSFMDGPLQYRCCQFIVSKSIRSLSVECFRCQPFRSRCFRGRGSPLSAHQWKLSPLFGQELWDESIFYEVATKKLWLLMFCWFFYVFGQIFVVFSHCWKCAHQCNNIFSSDFLKDCLFIYCWIVNAAMFCL